jgi:hypothetical protein
MDIQEEIQNFMSTHECVISREMSDKDIKSNFTTFGNRAGCRAIKDIIEFLDDDVKLKVLDMMKSKRVN